MNVLVLCEMSGVVRQAFREKGHSAWSCDLLPALDGSDFHWQGDIFNLPGLRDIDWDLVIAHPPCTALCVSGNHVYAEGKPRHSERIEALEFFRYCLNFPAKRKCVENPVGVVSTLIRKPDQIVQPYQFGDDASKKTCFWLENLEPLEIDPEERFEGRWVEWKGKLVERWSNQCDSGQNKLGPSAERGTLRGITYPGIARAMARTWG